MNAKIRSAVAMAVTVIGLSAYTTAYAAPIPVPVHAMFAKTKMVKLNLRNDSSAPMELKVGEDVITIDAGKTIAVKAAVGARIVTTTSTASHPSGTLLAEVTTALSDATIGIK